MDPLIVYTGCSRTETLACKVLLLLAYLYPGYSRLLGFALTLWECRCPCVIQEIRICELSFRLKNEIGAPVMGQNVPVAATRVECQI